MVFFKNAQWAVTEWGLEAARPGAPCEYFIPAHRLLERSHGELYDWPLHLAEKTWIDMDAFNEAFAEALEHHKGKYRGNVDKNMLLASIDCARKQVRR